jgi:hypothetical protein
MSRCYFSLLTVMAIGVAGCGSTSPHPMPPPFVRGVVQCLPGACRQAPLPRGSAPANLSVVGPNNTTTIPVRLNRHGISVFDAIYGEVMVRAVTRYAEAGRHTETDDSPVLLERSRAAK